MSPGIPSFSWPQLLPTSIAVTTPLDRVRLSARERAGIRRATATACRETAAPELLDTVSRILRSVSAKGHA